jgi:hypothetical protein
VASKLGLVDTFDKPGFKGMATEISFRQYSTIRNPNIHPERVVELYDTFSDYVSGTLEIPEKYANPVPPRGDSKSEVRDAASLEVAEIIKALPAYTAIQA